MARTVTYKGHRIRAHAIFVAESEEGEWAAQATVGVPTAAGAREQPLHDPDDRVFPTEEEAEGYGIHLAMRWVDRHDQ
jgi:hypothetical protein